MATKVKLTLPLALTIGVLGFLYVEFIANFSFHWVTSGSLGNGLDMPAKFHLIIPAGFLTWGMFFVLGANNDALKLVTINTLIGALSALILMFFVHIIRKEPDFWGISLMVGVLAFVLVMSSTLSDLVNIPTIFVTFAGTLFWWLATGADGWFPGSNVAHSPAGLAQAAAGASKGLTAGSGAFSGVISTPYGFVALNMAATMLIGVVFGYASARIAAVLTPSPAAHTADEHAEGARPNPA